MTTNDHKTGPAPGCNGPTPADAHDGVGPPAAQVAAHHDAAFYHESAAFHHRQAAQHLDNGRAADAERHIWAAFGHSLNAHEATRTGVSAMRGANQPTGRVDGSPTPDGPPTRRDHN